MITQNTTDLILRLMQADACVTAAELNAARKFFASGCSLTQSRISVDSGLLLTKSAAARLLGVSRTLFGAIAEEIVDDGRPRFIERYIAYEKFPRYERIALMEYANVDRSSVAVDQSNLQLAS